MSIKTFFWNVRGLNDPDKHHLFTSWLSSNQPVAGAILESHIKEPNLNLVMQRACKGWSYFANHDTDDDGRIIVIWKYPATVQILHQSRQSITCSVAVPGSTTFHLSAVYASNLRDERLRLWEDLKEVQTTLFLETRNWIVGGDFNQIIHHSEHSSPAVDHITPDMIEFHDTILDLEMADLRYQGSCYTWTNSSPSNPTTKKLDRALVNCQWLQSYPNSVASFLPFEFSDHSPCLIDLSCPLPSSGTKPFKFFNFLTNHPTFVDTVETAWNQCGNRAKDLCVLAYKLKHLKRALKTLNKESFSDISKKVSVTNILLKDVQAKLLEDPSTENFEAEKELHHHWNFLQGIEESFFKQKSRIKWLHLGDQNTLFFMRVATSRLSYNSIRSLMLSNGVLITDPELMCKIAVDHFTSILAPSELPQLHSPFHWFLQIIPFRYSQEQRSAIGSFPSDLEITTTILKLNPNKAPGPDGFTSAFFKSAWSIVGEETIATVRQFFLSCFLPSATNATILTLVPKKPGASSITDYRPISCCNTTYKAISNLLVKRLKIILPEAILPNQTAFIRGRLLIENTLLASEIVQGYHKNGGQKRITIKIDIAKAFDTIRWEFIFQCLRGLHLPEIFIHWIQACVCSTSFSVGFNGSLHGFFKGKRGLRQGDPLSPYLFVIAMNCLSLSLNMAAQRGDFKYHSKCDRTGLTHLCFADDLLIFCDGSAESVNAILGVLRDFEARSGLGISIEKTSIYYAGLKPHQMDAITFATGLTAGVLPVRYLGVPLCTKKLSILHCAPLIQSIKSKFQGWSSRSLSFAGRLQLISTVISGIINFWSSAYILPKAGLAEIDALCSKFLWKGKLDGSGGAKVAWEKVSVPKQEGGLGLKNWVCWNVACAIKLIWILFFKQDSIWATWYLAEVLEGNINNFWVINTKQKNSWLANYLLLQRDTVFDWIKMVVGNGETCYFWSSNWSPFGSITKYLRGESSRNTGIPTSATLAELWDQGAWQLPPARSEGQVNIQTHLTTLALTHEADAFQWMPHGKHSTIYSTREIYNLLRVHHQRVPWHKEVWFSKGIPRHKFLSWLFVLDKCPTKDRMMEWGFATDPMCILCNSGLESRDHLYFSCSYTWDIWYSVAGRSGFSSPRVWNEILRHLQKLHTPTHTRLLVLLAWQASIYCIWAERNARLHRSRFRPPSAIVKEIHTIVKLRIASIRIDDPHLASVLFQAWVS